ncbi:MAG TPA: ATP-binding protein [Kofleriaceae bacterium]|nr:ATP-binding protein [Kofleriaceae bacterium]
MDETPAAPLAVDCAADLRAALARVAPPLLARAQQCVPPIGWNGLARGLEAFANTLLDAPADGAFLRTLRALGVSQVETDIIVAAMSVDLDSRFASAWQLLGGRIDATRPRFGTLLQLLPATAHTEALRLLDPGHWLRALGAIDLVGDAEAMFDRTVVASPLFWGIDPQLTTLNIKPTALCESSYNGNSPLVDIQPRRRTDTDGPPTAVMVEGPTGSGRTWLARELAASVELPTVWATLDNRAQRQIATVIRQAVLHNLMPCFDLTSLNRADTEALLPTFAAWGSLYAGPMIFICEHRLHLPAPWQTWIVPAQRPSLEARTTLWTQALGERGTSELAEELARRFPLGRGAIYRAASEGIFRSAGTADAAMLAQAAREQLDTSSSVAERVRTARRMHELIAAPQTIALLQEILSFAHHRRTVFADWGFAQRFRGGLKVLFSGPPGTGKTMSAEIIAAELDLDLFKIDLSNVVSKWVGETEKNLKEVFDQAEANGGVLLFDEADALFGKRTINVQSSNDRHSNMEINYLLQRMEAFEGICLLTSNIESAIDEAFKRRLNFRVQFAKPDAVERAALWRSMIPSQTPRAGSLNFTEVAERFDMAGGNIRNAALRAALLAAAEQQPLATRHLLDAAQREFGESGRLSM